MQTFNFLDTVTTSGKYPNLEEDFKNRTAKVIAVKNVNLAYAGYCFVTVVFTDGTQRGYYGNALKVVNY